MSVYCFCKLSCACTEPAASAEGFASNVLYKRVIRITRKKRETFAESYQYNVAPTPVSPPPLSPPQIYYPRVFLSWTSNHCAAESKQQG